MKMETLSKTQAKALWIRAQGLDAEASFGEGAQAVPRAVQQLGYVQIDTINVIERCHHHILFNRIPGYKREYLHRAQTKDKTVFEYWTHALSYVPSVDFRFYMRDMKLRQAHPGVWFQSVQPKDFRRVMATIKKDGPISIRDIKDDVLVEKEHEWGSRKPSKRALQLGFYGGQLVISERLGMLKKYELTERHFEWDKKPKAATEKEVFEYLLDRSLRSQALVGLDSVCHLSPKRKPEIRKVIEKRVKKSELIPVRLEGVEKSQLWISPGDLESRVQIDPDRIHILSPFDPLIIQRKRLTDFFDYNHLFEAYVPPAKRVMGYFALPVLAGDRIVAALDLKTDRVQGKLLVQKWNWIGRHKSAALRRLIESSLHDFEQFQLDV